MDEHYDEWCYYDEPPNDDDFFKDDDDNKISTEIVTVNDCKIIATDHSEQKNN